MTVPVVMATSSPNNMGMRNMTELDPCLAGCDAALAEAQLLIAVLGGLEADDAALDPVRRSIAALRRAVDRLRGVKVITQRKNTDRFWTDMVTGQLPWPTLERPAADPV